MTRMMSARLCRHSRFRTGRSIRSLAVTAVLISAITLTVASLSAAEPSNGWPGGPTRHPDGALHHAALFASARYVSTYMDGLSGGFDHQAYRLGLSFIPVSRLTLLSEYAYVDRTESFHDVLGGFAFYFRAPNDTLGRVNADGPVGGPILTVLAGARLFDDPDSATILQGDVRVTIPVTARFSFGGGYRWREENSDTDAIDAYGVLSLYFASYRPDSAWANPDGPAGVPALRLLGGAGDGTWGFQTQLLVPLQADLTLTGTLGLDRLHNPRRTAYSVEFGFAWYLVR